MEVGAGRVLRRQVQIFWAMGHQLSLHTCHRAAQLLPLHNLTSTAHL